MQIEVLSSSMAASTSDTRTSGTNMSPITFALVSGLKMTTHTVDIDRSIIWSELATHAARILGAPRLGPVQWLDTVGEFDVFRAPGSARTTYQGTTYAHPILLLKSKGVASVSLT